MNSILLPGKEDGALIDIDLDNLNEEDVYNAFGVDGNEGEALNDIYPSLCTRQLWRSWHVPAGLWSVWLSQQQTLDGTAAWDSRAKSGYSISKT